MILLPDEDGLPVGTQVRTVIGEALRHSVAALEPGPEFGERLAAALDMPQQARAPDGPESEPAFPAATPQAGDFVAAS